MMASNSKITALASVLLMLAVAGAALVSADDSAADVTESTTLSSGTVGAAYSVTVQASTTTTIESIDSGTVPPGLSLSGRVLSGTPTTAGTYTFTTTETDTAQNEIYHVTYTITINAQAVDYVTAVSVSPTNLTLKVGQTATVTGGRTGTVYTEATWTPVQSGSAVSLSGSSVGSVTVTASAIGTATVRYYVTADSTTYHADCTVTVVEAQDLTITDPGALNALSGAKFSYTPTTSIAGSTVTMVSGPSWLSISSGVITGTVPTVTEKTVYTATFRATSPGGQTATQTLTFNAYPVAKLTSTDLTPAGTLGTAVGVTVSCNVACTFAVSGTLPDGVRFDTATGVFSGTLGSTGIYTVTVTGTTTEGPAQSPTITLTISAAGVLTITSTAPSDTYVSGGAYRYTPAASVSGTGLTWSITGAPSWLVLENSCVQGSVPAGLTEATVYTYTLTAVYSLGSSSQTATQDVTIRAEPVLVWTSVPTATCLVIPVYHYSSDGTPSVAAILGSAPSAETAVSASTHTYKFVYTGTGAETLSWSFGDGNTSTDWTPIHTYDKAGTYTYTLTASNEVGSSSTTGTITISDSGHGQDWLSANWWWVALLVSCIVVMIVRFIL